MSRWSDTPLANFMRVMADLLGLNLLFLAGCIPVVTIGASLSAMYAVLFHRERNDGAVAVIRTYAFALKQSFWKAILLGLILLAILGLALGDFWMVQQSEPPVTTVYTVVGTMVAVVAAVVFLFGFPQQALYRNKLSAYLKNSLILAACAPGQLLLALAAWVLPWYLAVAVSDVFLHFGVFYLLWGFSLPAWVTVKLLYPVFQKTKQDPGTEQINPTNP